MQTGNQSNCLIFNDYLWFVEFFDFQVQLILICNQYEGRN